MAAMVAQGGIYTVAAIAVCICCMVYIVPGLKRCRRDAVAIAACDVRDVPDRGGFWIIGGIGDVAVDIAAFGAIGEVAAQGKCSGKVHIYCAVGLVTRLVTGIGIESMAGGTAVTFVAVVLCMVASWGKAGCRS